MIMKVRSLITGCTEVSLLLHKASMKHSKTTQNSKVKGTVDSKMKIISFFTPPHAIPDATFFLQIHKIFKENNLHSALIFMSS